NNNNILEDSPAAAGSQMNLTHQTTLTINRSEAYKLSDTIRSRKHTTSLLDTTQTYKSISSPAPATQQIEENFYPAPCILPSQQTLYHRCAAYLLATPRYGGVRRLQQWLHRFVFGQCGRRDRTARLAGQHHQSPVFRQA